MSQENAEKTGTAATDSQDWRNSSDFDEYIRQEATRLGVSEDEIRAREEAASKDVVHLSRSLEQLRKIADHSVPPKKYLDGEESCPF